MAQQYGVAQPIADWVQSRIARPVEGVLGLIDRLPSRTDSRADTSWHDAMVRNAGRSFQPKPAARPVKKPVVKRSSKRK